MPVITRYCDKCGSKIPSDDFDRGKAISYLYLAYCQNCKSAVEKVVAACKEYKEFEGAGKKKKSPAAAYLPYILIVVVAVLGVVAGMMLKGSPPPQTGSTGGGGGVSEAKLAAAVKDAEDKIRSEYDPKLSEYATQIDSLTKERDLQKAQIKSANDANLELRQKLETAGGEKLLAENKQLKEDNDKNVNRLNELVARSDALVSERDRLSKENMTLAEKARSTDAITKQLVLSDVQVALCAWESAYNNADHEALLSCYSENSDYKTEYRANKNEVAAAFKNGIGKYRYRVTAVADDAEVKGTEVTLPVKLVVRDSETNNVATNVTQRWTLVKESGRWKISKQEE